MAAAGGAGRAGTALPIVTGMEDGLVAVSTEAITVIVLLSMAIPICICATTTMCTGAGKVSYHRQEMRKVLQETTAFVGIVGSGPPAEITSLRTGREIF